MDQPNESQQETQTQAHAANHSAPHGGRPLRSEVHNRGRRAIDLAQWLKIGRGLSGQVEEQVHKQPLAILGAAAGLGFAAGSLFGSRLGQLLLAGAVGYAMRNASSGEGGVERIRAGIKKLAHDGDVD